MSHIGLVSLMLDSVFSHLVSHQSCILTVSRPPKPFTVLCVTQCLAAAPARKATIRRLCLAMLGDILREASLTVGACGHMNINIYDGVRGHPACGPQVKRPSCGCMHHRCWRGRGRSTCCSGRFSRAPAAGTRCRTSQPSKQTGCPKPRPMCSGG